VDIFAKHDNLYISFVNINNNNQPEIIILYDSEQKERDKAMMGNNNFTDPLDGLLEDNGKWIDLILI
jgi:hypothetical protein